MDLTISKVSVYKKYPELFTLSFKENDYISIADILSIQKYKIAKGQKITLNQNTITDFIIAELIAKYKRVLFSNNKSGKEIFYKIKNELAIQTRLEEYSKLIKLPDSISSQIKEDLLQKLKDLNLINDTLASEKISDKLIRRGKPIGYIKSKLRSLGIDSDIDIKIDPLVESANLTHEIEKFIRINKHKSDIKNSKNRLVTSLVRKGYSLREILPAVDTVFAYYYNKNS